MTRVFYGSQNRANNHSERRPGMRAPYSHHRGHNPRFQRASNNAPRQHKIPAEFFGITKQHFVLLKCVHHQSVLEGGSPPSLIKKVDLISESVNPAFVNDAFRSRMKAISSEWCSAVQQALLGHYSSLVADAIQFISSNGIYADLLERSLQMVIRWSRSQLGKKLSDGVLDKAITMIKTHQLLIERTPPGCSNTSAPYNDDRSTQGHSFPLNGFVAYQFPAPFDVPSASLSLKEVADKDTQTDVMVGSPIRTVASHGSSICDDTVGSPSSHTVDPSVSMSEGIVATHSAVEKDLNQPTTSALVQTKIVDVNTLSSRGASSNSFDRFHLDTSKSTVILGDVNLRDLDVENSAIFSTDKGRLSFFKQYLQTFHSVHENVSNFVLCLSSLDEKNKHATNYSTFRSVVYNAKRIFPNAKISILPNIIAMSTDDDLRTDIREFNDTITQKLRSVCELIPVPEDFSVKDNFWSASERNFVFRCLKDFLSKL